MPEETEGPGEPQGFGPAYWEERYRGHGPHPATEPSPHLVALTRDLTPGTALDVGCGEGADVLWLAAQGWRVTGTDVSTTALRRARAHAEARGAVVVSRVDWVRADLTTEEWPGAGSFDLVSAHYVHPATTREDLLARLTARVAPGGRLLVVGHHPSDAHSRAHASGPQVHATAEELLALLDPDRWEVVAAGTRTRAFPARPGEAAATSRDTVLCARRRG